MSDKSFQMCIIRKDLYMGERFNDSVFQNMNITGDGQTYEDCVFLKEDLLAHVLSEMYEDDIETIIYKYGISKALSDYGENVMFDYHDSKNGFRKIVRKIIEFNIAIFRKSSK
jgi:hypothetical protein